MSLICAFVVTAVNRIARRVLLQVLSPVCFVSRSLYVSVCLVDCEKTADWFWMTLEMMGKLGPRMRQVVGIRDCPTLRDNFRASYGASHCNLWGLCGVVV